MTEIKPRIIACPRCGTQTEYSTENQYRPFCSERCRLIDLGAWADGAYRVPSQESGQIQDPLLGSDSEDED